MMTTWIFITLLMLIGVAMLVVEICLLPGTTVAGFVGGFIVLLGLYKSFAVSVEAGVIVTIISTIVFLLAVYFLIRSKTLSKLSLKTEIDSKIEPLQNVKIAVGDKAITVSRLAPMGKIRINNTVAEAKSVDGFIDEGCEVEVTAVGNVTIEVKKFNS